MPQDDPRMLNVDGVAAQIIRDLALATAAPNLEELVPGVKVYRRKDRATSAGRCPTFARLGNSKGKRFQKYLPGQ